jgi:hypothetical protein
MNRAARRHKGPKVAGDLTKGKLSGEEGTGMMTEIRREKKEGRL